MDANVLRFLQGMMLIEWLVWQTRHANDNIFLFLMDIYVIFLYF